MEPLLSVVMPAYNCEKFIGQAIESVLAQSYANIELLIADDCSTDNTRKIIESYTDKRIKLFNNSQNLGYLKTCNKLLALSKGEYISFQDADDATHTDRLQIQYNYLLANPGYSVCGCNLLYVDAQGKELYCSVFVKDGEEIKQTMPNREYFYSPNTFLFKRDVLETIGGYNEYFDRIGAEDYYWTGLIVWKYKIINLPQALYYYRFNPNSISGNLSDNPKKLYSSEIVRHLFNQRCATGTDDLEQGNAAAVDKYVAEVAAPFLNDKGHFLHTLAKRYYYENKREQAIKFIFKAIANKPYRVGYYKDLLYFVRNRP